MIVDRMLPGLDGISLVKTLRGAKSRTPVLFLTALGGVGDRIEGLNSGADDYFVKPFAFGELSARIAALGRRPQMTDKPTILRARDLENEPPQPTDQEGRHRDRPSAARVLVAGMSSAAQRQDPDPHHVARSRMGYPF